MQLTCQMYFCTTNLHCLTLLVIFFTPTSGFTGGGLTQSLQTLHTHACDGEHVKVVCPVRTVISIQYAKYGRSVPSSEMCPQVRLGDVLLYDEDTPLLENTNCIAVRSLEVVLDLCEDRSRCSVSASSETFTQDPCVGTPKYLEVHYKCRPDEFEHQTACEDETLDISCGRGDRIAVYSAMFGRTTNGTDKCPADKQEYIDLPDCVATGALSEVSALCHGKRNCAILANQSVFGDPCDSGIKKYLSVSYACVPRNILKQMQRRTNKKKKKRKKKKKKGHGEGGEEFDGVLNTTTNTPSAVPPSDHILLPSSEVFETFEQESATQATSATGSLLEEIKQHHSMNEFNSESTDVTTVQSETVSTTNDDVNIDVSDSPDDTHRNHSKHHLETVSDIDVSGNNQYDEIDDVTEAVVSTLSYNISDDIRDIELNFDSNDDKVDNYQDVNSKDDEYGGVRNVDDLASNQVIQTTDNILDISGSKDSEDIPGARSTTTSLILSTTWNPDLESNAKNEESEIESDLLQVPNLDKVKNVPESPYVTERNLTVLCINYTRPEIRWLVRPVSGYTIGFLRDWFSVIHFLQVHQEKGWLYFTLGICFGIIVMLVVVLIKVCINFHRKIRARLDVSEPTHRNTHTNNHSTLDAPMLEHSDSVDRIEVVRFSPRNTLRSQRSNSHHRDLVNYYG